MVSVHLCSPMNMVAIAHLPLLKSHRGLSGAMYIPGEDLNMIQEDSENTKVHQERIMFMMIKTIMTTTMMLMVTTRLVPRIPITKGGTSVMRAAASCHQLRTAPRLRSERS